jgi:hypothetical protein
MHSAVVEDLVPYHLTSVITLQFWACHHAIDIGY